MLERGTRGLAEEIDAVTGRARGGGAAPDVGPVGGRGARDAASRTAARVFFSPCHEWLAQFTALR